MWGAFPAAWGEGPRRSVIVYAALAPEVPGRGHVEAADQITSDPATRPLAASTWPRFGSRGWRTTVATSTPLRKLQRGRTSMDADRTAAHRLMSPFQQLQRGRGSVAADRTAAEVGWMHAQGWLQRGRGLEAADRAQRGAGHLCCHGTSTWPRLGSRGSGRSGASPPGNGAWPERARNSSSKESSEALEMDRPRLTATPKGRS
jgi:hypothetical protein